MPSDYRFRGGQPARARHRSPRRERLPSRAHPLGLRAGLRARRRRGRARHRRDARRRAGAAPRERDLGHDGCRGAARVRRPAHDASEVDGAALTGWFTEDFTWAELSTLRARERLAALRQRSRELRRPLPDPPAARPVRAHRHGRRASSGRLHRAWSPSSSTRPTSPRSGCRSTSCSPPSSTPPAGARRRPAHHGGVRADGARPARGRAASAARDVFLVEATGAPSDLVARATARRRRATTRSADRRGPRARSPVGSTA